MYDQILRYLRGALPAEDCQALGEDSLRAIAKHANGLRKACTWGPAIP